MILRLGYLATGWLAVAGFLYASWRIPRLPSVMQLVGHLPAWAIVAGTATWCVAVLGLVGVGIMPRRAWARPELAIGATAAAIVLLVFPIYLLQPDRGWRGNLGLAVGFFWIACVLVNKIAFLVRARAERRQRQ
jgi:hypothetical protein